MKCISVAENLDALLDGEIESAQKRKVENHLEICPSCQTEFNNLQAMSQTLKRSLAISAPPLLDDKIFGEFKSFHAAKAADKSPREKIGWFGIPRFALAATLVLFTFGIIAAFQIGKMSAGEIVVSMPQVQENDTPETAKNDSIENEKSVQIKYVEVPVVQEKIVKVPVVQEKIVTRIIYKNVDVEDTKKSLLNSDKTKDFTVSSRLKDNRYSTRTNLKGFQIVSDLNPKIIKGENNEK